MKAICGLMCSTAPRCSTSSPTSLLFVVSGAVRFATSEFWDSRVSRSPRPWTLTLASLASNHPRISWFVSCQPKGRSNFCSVARSQSFTLITKSSTKTDWLDLTVYFQNRIRTCNVYTLYISINEDPRVVELVVLVFCIFDHSHLMSSQHISTALPLL